MLGLLKKALVWIIFVSLLVNFFPMKFAKAQASSCSGIVSPATVIAGTTSGFILQISNTSLSEIIAWVKITRPSANFTLTQASGPSGWTISSQTATSTTFTGGNIPPGLTRSFQERNVAIANVNAPSANWIVEVSSDPSGANPVACTGSLGTEITGASDANPPVISNVTVSSITTNSAVVGWTTDEHSTSKVDFGLTSGYGQSVSNGSMVTNHSLTIQSLSPSTIYHFKVSSTDSSGNTGNGNDTTFQTLSSGSNPNPPPPSGSISIKKLNIQSTEKIPPSISFTSKTRGVYKEGPLVSGIAQDNVAVLLVEYSVDAGKNWLPVKKTSGLGTQKTSFEFSTSGLAEGNFEVLARAIDTSGNEAKTGSFTLVIDIHKPFIGGSLVSFGPQILSGEGSLATLVGMKQKITLPVIGGATEVKIVAKKEGAPEIDFKLNPLNQSNLWNGEIVFPESGIFDLEVHSKDGAANQVKRTLSEISVTPAGGVVDKKNQPIQGAKVSLYFFEPESQAWVLWDGSGFGIANPQQTDAKGQFSYLIPKGKYYFKAETKEYLTWTSEIFETSGPTPLSTKVQLEKPFLKLGPLLVDWRVFFAKKVEIGKFEKSSQVSNEVNNPLPNFSFESTSGQKIDSLSLRGKPTLLTILSTWSPNVSEQLPILNQLAENKDLNIVPLISMESLGRVKVFKEISKTKLEFIVDPNGEISQSLKFQSLPTHYVLTRNGVIKKVLVGVLSKEELLDALGSQ